MKEKLFACAQYFLPHHLISRAAHCIVESKVGWLKNCLINKAIHRFGVDLSEATEENPTAYPNFNAFFTRSLKEDARPLPKDSNTIASPADGIISQIGTIENGRIFQAKGHDYSLIELLGGDVTLAKEFMGGNFSTVYLAPRDYHRVHSPATGQLRQMIHVPGRLFSVNQGTVENIPNLFSRNERVISILDTEYGPMAVIMVGAMIVASIETVWAGQVTPYKKEVKSVHYSSAQYKDIILQRGNELGRFKMGSTAIVLFGKDQVEWASHWQAGNRIKMGEALGKAHQSVDTSSSITQEPETPSDAI